MLLERDGIGRTPHFAEIRLDANVPAGVVLRARVHGHDGQRLSGEVAA